MAIADDCERDALTADLPTTRLTLRASGNELQKTATYLVACPSRRRKGCASMASY